MASSENMWYILTTIYWKAGFLDSGKAADFLSSLISSVLSWVLGSSHWAAAWDKMMKQVDMVSIFIEVIFNIQNNKISNKKPMNSIIINFYKLLQMSKWMNKLKKRSRQNCLVHTAGPWFLMLSVKNFTGHQHQARPFPDYWSRQWLWNHFWTQTKHEHCSNHTEGKLFLCLS